MTLAEMIGKRIQSKLKAVGTNEYFIVIKFSVLQEAGTHLCSTLNNLHRFLSGFYYHSGDKAQPKGPWFLIYVILDSSVHGTCMTLIKLLTIAEILVTKRRMIVTILKELSREWKIIL